MPVETSAEGARQPLPVGLEREVGDDGTRRRP